MSRIFAFMLLLSFIVLFVPVQAQEIVEFPALSGEFQVGRAYYHLIDENREEIFTLRSGDFRQVMVTVFYPAAPDSGDVSAPFVEVDMRTALSRGNRRVAPLNWDNIISHSYASVPVSDQNPNYPILLFSPGITMNPLFYTAMLETIASHGYIVLALAHPYSVDEVVFSDGRVVHMGGVGLGFLAFDPERDPERFERAFMLVLGVWVEDAQFVLDQMAILNEQDDLLKGHLDLSQVGMFGHSFGGSASVEAIYRDERFLAAFNLEGPIFGEAADNGVTRPVVMVASDWSWRTSPDDSFGMPVQDFMDDQKSFIADLRAVAETSQAGYVIRLIGSAHGTFSDLPLLKPIGGTDFNYLAASIGAIEAERAHEVLTDYIVAFFNKYVRELDVPLLDGTSDDYPEVVFEFPDAMQ